jgi:hypothetical protein
MRAMPANVAQKRDSHSREHFSGGKRMMGEMSKPKPREIPDIRVEDPEAAFHKLEDFTRRVMAIPKKEIDRSMKRREIHKPKKGH